MNTHWPEDLKIETKDNSIVIHLTNAFHFDYSENNAFFGIPFMIMGLIGCVAIVVEYFDSFLSLLAFFTLIFILVGMSQMGGNNYEAKSLEIRSNEIKIDCGRRGIYSYLIADIKQFYVRSNGNLYAILEDFGHEKHIIFLRGLPKSTTFALAEALENHLDIYDIAVTNEIRL